MSKCVEVIRAILIMAEHILPIDFHISIQFLFKIQGIQRLKWSNLKCLSIIKVYIEGMFIIRFTWYMQNVTLEIPLEATGLL